MDRLYCPKDYIYGEQIVLNERKQIHYLYDVLRLKTNDYITVFDGQGNEYDCQIQELTKKLPSLLLGPKLMLSFIRYII